MSRDDRWAVAEAEEDGMPLLFRHRQNLPVKNSEQFPYLISILWVYDRKRQSGMPDDETLAQMDRVEDALDPIDQSGDAFLMVAVTGNNRREWIWYTDDKARYMQLVHQALPKKTKFPLDFSASEDPAWLTYLSIREASGGGGE